MSTEIINFSDFVTKEKLDSEVSNKRKPLYESHLKTSEKEGGDFTLRMDRIKRSLERINNLMTELKDISHAQKSGKKIKH